MIVNTITKRQKTYKQQVSNFKHQLKKKRKTKTGNRNKVNLYFESLRLSEVWKKTNNLQTNKTTKKNLLIINLDTNTIKKTSQRKARIYVKFSQGKPGKKHTGQHNKEND